MNILIYMHSSYGNILIYMHSSYGNKGRIAVRSVHRTRLKGYYLVNLIYINSVIIHNQLLQSFPFTEIYILNLIKTNRRYLNQREKEPNHHQMIDFFRKLGTQLYFVNYSHAPLEKDVLSFFKVLIGCFKSFLNGRNISQEITY